MTQRFRNARGGRIDRGVTWRFRFDGRGYAGHPGDTLASALLANGVRLVGRSFKYHRPRGILAAGPDEPNALAELRSGARREPNTRMTVAELFDGLEARSQNRFPSLGWDLLALNQLAAPLLQAGFYYKTFMWPPSWWEKVYEPWIRRAAGLGRAATAPDPDRYGSATAHCDVLVVGGGAAGLAAARTAGEAGARVLLCEQDFLPGGAMLADPRQADWLAETVAALRRMPEVRLLTRTTVHSAWDGNVFAGVERVADHLAEPPPHGPRQRAWTIFPRAVVLATGAHERFIAFPGNDRPGVMLAGAAAALAVRWAVRPGQRAVLFANHDAAYDSLFALQEAGVAVAGVVDPRPGSAAMDAARARGIAVHAESEVTGSIGGRTLRGVRLRRRGGAGSETAIAADLLCVSGGFNPAASLASQAGARLEWDEALAAFLPAAPVQPQFFAGALVGQGIARAAVQSGARAGAAAAALGGFRRDSAIPLPAPGGAEAAVLPLWEVRGRGKAFVDLQHDVTAADMRLAHREGYAHIELAKRYTTLAMGTDQGKVGGILGTAVLAEARGVQVPEVGLPRHRPFATPVTWGALAGEHVGRHFAPVRRTPLHDCHARRGAVFVEAGHWLRPAWYPAAGDADDWTAILREARNVRETVGLCDVSTLGKIDVQGPDAAAFLDRIYANTFSTLPVGRARYGLMLREDGIAFDDGTTSRLADDRYYMTTTTANAAAVMAHLEFHLQTAWPDLDVQLASVTDQWAAMSLAGPRARELLSGLLRGPDLSNAAFPFMSVADAELADCPVRVFRISFSGELAYEIATPAGFAERVWEALLAAGERFGAAPYGVEALGLLRIEKGHPAGAELNGQTTAADLGMARLLKKRGDFVGRVLAGRPGLADPARPRLVGLRPVDPAARLRAGAHLLDADGTDLGWVSSVTRSVELGQWIGLGLLAEGENRMGQHVTAAFPLYGESLAVEVANPCFVDPENARVRA